MMGHGKRSLQLPRAMQIAAQQTRTGTLTCFRDAAPAAWPTLAGSRACRCCKTVRKTCTACGAPTRPSTACRLLTCLHVSPPLAFCSLPAAALLVP